jgi:hypothetical protein
MLAKLPTQKKKKKKKKKNPSLGDKKNGGFIIAS